MSCCCSCCCSKCFFCCPWRHQQESEPKNEQSLGMEATSTPTSESAFAKACDANNNIEDCSISGRDIDNSVVTRQPPSIYAAGQEERKALMGSVLTSSENSYSDHGSPCFRPGNKKEFKPITKLMKNKESELAGQDSSKQLFNPDRVGGLELRLTVDFDEEPCQELLELLQEVLSQRPVVQTGPGQKPAQNKDKVTKTTAADLMTEEAVMNSIETKVPLGPMEQISVSDSNQAFEQEFNDQDLDVPSQRELGEELLQLLLAVHEQRSKQQQPSQKPKPQLPQQQSKVQQPPAAPPAEAAGEKQQLSPFELQMMEAHNYYRAHHSAPPLTHCSELRQRAQCWAEYIALRDLQLLEPQALDGQNGGCVVASEDRQDVNGAFFVTGWYKLGQHYQFSGRERGKNAACGTTTTAHFEQVVWKSTQSVGFGRAISASGRVFVVARYRPPGRVSNDFEANVLPPVDGKMARPY